MSFISKTTAISALALLAFAGCKKTDEVHMTNAIISGYDLRACACCGGLMITFSNDPNPYHSSFYLVRNMPEGTGINEQTQFPVYVRVVWKPVTGGCGQNVDILQLEKRF